MNFKNKTALITGAAVGIGRAVAHKLLENGANVVLLDFDKEKLALLAQELSAYADKIQTAVCDISNEAAVNDTVNSAYQRFGKIDILVNNAAIWRVFSPFTETNNETWKKFLDINIMGVVNVTRAVLPKMCENHYGKIVNVSSVAGVYGIANMVHYSATKGALIAMTKALAKEVADKGVNVNCVSPGTVSDSGNPDMDSYTTCDMAYLDRTGTNNENASLICYLASDEAAYIDGQNIQIDGLRRRQ